MSALARRRHVRTAVLLLGSLVFSAIFWRVEESVHVATVMLGVTYGSAATFICWLHRPAVSRFLIPVATMGFWTLCAAWLGFLMPFRMSEEEAKSLVSPDG